MLCYMCHDLCIHVFAMTRAQVCDACRTLSPLVYRVASLSHMRTLYLSLSISLSISLYYTLPRTSHILGSTPHCPCIISPPSLSLSLALSRSCSFSRACSHSLSCSLSSSTFFRFRSCALSHAHAHCFSIFLQCSGTTYSKRESRDHMKWT